ncbi:excinuclease ABC subunit C [Neokomagataea thailandica NBRC 106555]|uniref:UvrABC system protein C n=2 Tax=Neokomagataea TaxID=1223423 RepID=A0A4Y6VAK8_9PROT|nr:MULTISPECIES: excinuclease ABC subunit UvrC [Neokomagataea]QDH25601.1 excinuclease ABC subunit UvrC [Neokomagataea tanensis]GBR52569.1 excinuclease ABC subunit C [Neokomagataea thailandica NBRC 106555]
MIENTPLETADTPVGVDAIRNALKTIPQNPGVYRMLGSKGEVLYVGKALNLKNRVTSYLRIQQLPERLRRMVSLTSSMEIVITNSEADALLLEANYIKRMKPRFNILLRDDKSLPWLVLTESHDFPQITKQRGKPVKGASYWGPFASAWAVNQTLNLIQRNFLLRTCSDAMLSSRTRPCLLYQIKRCSAPCVDRISAADYAGLVEQARLFLSGKSTELHEQLIAEMEEASASLEFERAASIRDRIRGFTGLQQSGVINPTSLPDTDVVTIWQTAGQSCIQVFFIRGGRNNGNRAFYPSHDPEESESAVLSAFLLQFYENKTPPTSLLINHNLDEQSLVVDALSLTKGQKISITVPQRGQKKDILEHAALNAREALERKLAESAGQKQLLEGVAKIFDLPNTPQRIETYDNSHIMGQAPYGVMVVGGPEGFEKRAYRKYSIKGNVTPGDDFGMMREVMERRFKNHQSASPESLPDLLLIDGGQGQFNAVRDILSALGVNVPIAAMAKGPDRDAGREWFFTQHKAPFQLPERDPVLYYLQRLRDEAHRFAITTHRTGRSKKLKSSALDSIPNIGPARKKLLLNHFGSSKGVQQASLDTLLAVPGINHSMAETIYGHFHPEGS